MLEEIIYLKQILKKGYFADPPFVGMYIFSHYMGCSHGCIYYDRRVEKYFFEGDFYNGTFNYNTLKLN